MNLKQLVLNCRNQCQTWWQQVTSNPTVSPAPPVAPAAAHPGLSFLAMGIVIIVIIVGIFFSLTLSSVKATKKAEAKKVTAEEARQRAIAFARANPIIVEFPTSGEGQATKKVGVKLWLDPPKTRVRTSRPARYVFLKDDSLTYEDTEGTSVINDEQKQKWLALIPGEYIVYPLKGDKMYVKWSQ